jgi:hypothetical protein
MAVGEYSSNSADVNRPDRRRDGDLLRFGVLKRSYAVARDQGAGSTRSKSRHGSSRSSRSGMPLRCLRYCRLSSHWCPDPGCRFNAVGAGAAKKMRISNVGVAEGLNRKQQ